MEYFPLSLSQNNILNLEKMFPGTSIGNICATIHMEGDVDLDLLKESIYFVLEHDTSFHLRLKEEEGETVQYYAEYVREEFSIYDFSHSSEEGFAMWESSVAARPLSLEGPLYQFELFRRGEGRGGFLIKIHHLIGDGWSALSLCNKIGNTYLEMLDGKEISVVQPSSYQDYVQEEQAYLGSKAYGRDEAYWREILELGGEPALLKNINSAKVSPVGKRIRFPLPERLNQAIYRYCEEKRVSPFAVFYMALALYLRRTGTEERFVIGVPVLNRTNYKWKQTTGMFVTTLPFFNELNEEWTWNEFNENVKDSWYKLLKHQRFPYSDMNQMAGGEGRLFHVALSYQDGQFMENWNPSVAFTGSWHYCGYQAEQLMIHMTSLFKHRQYSIDYDYLVQFFSETEIERLHHNLCEIMTKALDNPDMPLYSISILCPEQKEQVLYTFNRTECYREEVSVYNALVQRNAHHLNRTAVICGGRKVSYRELLYRSKKLAASLVPCISDTETLIGIFLPREEHLLVAMTAVLQAGCAYVVLSEELPKERIRKILNSSGAKGLITDRRIGSSLEWTKGQTIYVDEVFESEHFQYTKEGSFGWNLDDDFDEKEWNASSDVPLAERLAYVVYTSGSTGEPKGVEITHSNLMNLADEMKGIYGDGAVLSVCNTGFDAFMLESIVALLNGRTILFPGKEELESPASLAELMKGYRVGSICITPSRLSAFLLEDSFRQAARRLESIVCGGEAFPQELLRKLKKYTHGRIYNQYGPSETTVAVSFKELTCSGKITAGRPMSNCRIYVLDQWMKPVPVESSGHVYIGGTCVGRGYRNQPELTEEAFSESPFVVGERIYNTGDLGYWTPDGELVLTGRQDDQVKLRGLRVELQEISSCIEAYRGVTSAFAVVHEIHGQQVLGAYYCSEEPIDESMLLVHVASYLPQYMIPAFIMHIEDVPVSKNGKADIQNLPLPDMGRQSGDCMVSDMEQIVLKVFRQVLKTEELFVESDYFLFGGNSLNAMECIIKLEKETGARLRVSDLYGCRTAAKVAAYLENKTKSQERRMGLQEKDGWRKSSVLDRSYPMSPVQQGMYIQSMMDETGLSYNMPGAFLLGKEPDLDSLKKAFDTLLESDPILRTSYRQGSEGIRAFVEEHVEFQLEELAGTCFEDAAKAFVRPFNLGKAPLLRGGLWHGEEGVFLFLDSHHMIGDGMSTPILLERLNLAYQGMDLNVKWNYYDFMKNSLKKRKQANKEEELNYWETVLKNLPDTLKLPGDSSASGTFDFKGADFEYSLSEVRSQDIERFCRERGISEFVLFLSAYGILLSEVSGQRDFVIGAPVAGRLEAETKEILGPFINTLPLRLCIDPKGSVKDFMDHVSAGVSGMLDHQNVSLEEIIQRLHLPRGQQNALYQVMMTQSPVDENAFVMDGERMTYHPISTGCAKMDLILDLSKSKEGYKLRFSYADYLFREETIAFYGRCMEQILGQLIENSEMESEGVKIANLQILSKEDTRIYVQIPNETKVSFEELPVHTILKNVSASKRTETAIIYHGEEYSFAWLEKRAGAVAYFIEEKGIAPGIPVGLCLSRTPDMIAAMYGVLKAGCAYVFMLPSFPEARLTYMTEISGAGLVLYDETAYEQMPEEYRKKLSGCKAYPLPEGEVDGYEDRPIGSDYLVNVLFTSGSTGKPKGVMLKHRSISNLYTQMETLLEPIEGRVLCSTNSVFDCFVVETIIALALGRCVVLADEEEMMLPWKLASLVSTYKTGVFEMTPSRLQMCLGNDAFCKAACHIGIVLLGGEVVTKTLMEKFYAHSDGILMNMYGPTEATVFTTMEPLVSGEHITIGRPLNNTRTYVLDEDLRPVMPTAVGELYIAGECLAKGYVNRPELTNASFLNDIYYPGEKMYRSGDLVRLRADGRFDYIGRKDGQVKLNGQRVELSEITGAVLEAGEILTAAVVPVRKEDGSMELCAFYQEKEGASVQTEEIKQQLKKVLPVYMIPSRLVKLEKMPMTATNKIDMQLLKTMTGKQEASVQEGNNSSYILSVWNKVLSRPATDENVSFFELGGTSLDALNVLSHYFNDHMEMTIGQFYENPTAAMQAKLLLKDRKKEFVPVEKAAFVTGGTGFFGIHLVKELVEQGKSVICLLRDGSKERFMESLDWYFGLEYREKAQSRIQILKGDIREELLGMNPGDYEKVCCRIDEIYHCAADVRHYASDEEDYLKTNVDGTKHMVDLAKCSGAALYHMSTCSVAGDKLKKSIHAESVHFTEQDYDIGQNWEDNIYVKSKFLAERYVLDGMKEGVKGKIFRLGRLVGRASDGKFQKNPQTNSFYLHVQGLLRLGVIPEEMKDFPLDLMPVDLAAKEVTALKEGVQQVYHIMSHAPAGMLDTLKALNPETRAVSKEELEHLFLEKLSELPKVLLPFLMELRTEKSVEDTRIEVTNQITVEQLKKNGFELELPKPEQLLKDFRGETWYQILQ